MLEVKVFEAMKEIDPTILNKNLEWWDLASYLKHNLLNLADYYGQVSDNEKEDLIFEIELASFSERFNFSQKEAIQYVADWWLGLQWSPDDEYQEKADKLYPEYKKRIKTINSLDEFIVFKNEWWRDTFTGVSLPPSFAMKEEMEELLKKK